MKKTIKLTESDLSKLVKRIIKESKERDYDYIDNLLGEYYGLHPNYLWYEEFENSRSYDKDMSDDEYVEAIYEFIQSGDENDLDIGDYLKSNCRSWEYDCDNYDDTMSLTNHLKQKYPKTSFDDLFKISKHWTGYERD